MVCQTQKRSKEGGLHLKHKKQNKQIASILSSPSYGTFEDDVPFPQAEHVSFVLGSMFRSNTKGFRMAISGESHAMQRFFVEIFKIHPPGNESISARVKVVAVWGMVIPPSIGNPSNGYINLYTLLLD